MVRALARRVRHGAGIATSVAMVLGVYGCGDARVSATLCGDLSVPTEFDSVRVTFFDDDFQERGTGVVLFVNPETTIVRQLPVVTELDTATSSGWARATALSEGTPVLRFDRRVPSFDDVSSIELVLTNACLGSIRCSLGQTCIEGECRLAPANQEEPRCSP